MTTQGITTQRQRELIDKLTRLVARRAKDEVEIRQSNAARADEAQRDHDQQRNRATAEFEHQHAKLIHDYKEAKEAIFLRYETEGFALAQEENSFQEEAAQAHAEALDEVKNLRQIRLQAIQEAFTTQEVAPNNEFAQFKQQCETGGTEIQALVAEAQKIVRRRCPWPETNAPAAQTPPMGLSRQTHVQRAAAALAIAQHQLVALRHQPAARFLEDGWPLLIFIFSAILGAYPLWLLVGPLGVAWFAAACFVVPLVLALGVRQAVRPFARKQTLRVVPLFQQAVAQSQAELNAAFEAAKVETKYAQRSLVKRRDKDLATANAEFEATCEQRVERHQTRLKKSAAEFAARRTRIEDTHERQLREIEEKYPRQIQQLEQDFERRIVELSDAFRARRAANRQQFEREWNALVTQWDAGVAEFQQVIGAMNQFCNRHFPPWDEVDWERWQPRSLAAPRLGRSDENPTNENAADNGEENGEPVGSLSAVRFGRFDFNMETLEGGLPSGAELAIPPAQFVLPAVLSYPECPSLLLEVEGDGRDVATRVIQDVMLRLLTAFPPSKVRFTIIDPVGLGQNFSAFMHLADYDERLVSSRIWTESTHIHQRLADLTEHMENVIQKYLRNEFASIQEYNEHAGEVAEAFQILVVANFPANFSDEAARRLVSIANSGARCGVYTLISTDTKLNLPRNFELADLESQAATLVWDVERQRLCWKHEDLRHLPLSVEEPPDDDRFTTIVRAVGRFAKVAARVEVPFESIIPADDRWWCADSRAEIEVPLGRVGAKKLQYMRLGQGTSQHVLIAGKTGSGKSTLLNAMITNLAIHYSPDELQFYLIDFKKGVEFKAYATFRLPHARVIAIESEREFGMSVLERLDLELKRRGDLFRKHGVQDVKGYRNAQPAAVMPRILLVIDEFQEFFTHDDKISHDSSLLLDRLVRQGRAFGIHVLLGSQTLAGAYSLARSTIGQMAVRIALQCSESDAHLILSEDNTAARLLSRPGEAIYNDANGLFEGNHPFQAVWLPDHQREGFLRRLAEMADQRPVPLPTPTVFEGNVAADPSDNDLLRELLDAPPPAERPLAPRAWLGAAVAIKDPTHVVFRRQGGSNVLIVGQQEELALGMFANILIALQAQLGLIPPAVAAPAESSGEDSVAGPWHRYYVLDGTRPESPEAGFWRRLNSHTGLDAQIVTPRDAADIVRRIAAEVDRRLAAADQTSAPIFLVIGNLSRFRDLKKSDDFSYDDAATATAEKQLATLLREGPALGVHSLLWCDSYNNLNRWVDRPTMRDLELRVLFQMSANDSSNLMDSPAASRLGAHMAISFSEAQGQAEKFRPYGLPTKAWLTSVGERFTRRA